MKMISKISIIFIRGVMLILYNEVRDLELFGLELFIVIKDFYLGYIWFC